MSADANVGAVSVAVDHEADFRTFFRAEYPRLVAYGRRLLRDEQLARDVAQEALVRVWSRWGNVHEHRAFTYLVALNLVRHEWKARARRDALLRLLARERPANEPAEHRVAELVAELPRRLCEVVLLYYYSDLCTEDVAAALGRPAGTVRAQLAEARALLGRRLVEWSDDE